jgi:2-keto-3-deoxy-L-rhamnonate aldolase RhmA
MATWLNIRLVSSPRQGPPLVDMLSFRHRVLRRERLAGSFIKLPTHQAVEISGSSGLDFVIVDAEHAPFSPEMVDRCVVAGLAAGIAVLVRVPYAESSMIQQALDLGAAGIVVPHVSSQAGAEAVVARTRLRGGLRGYSNSPRAGDFGRVGMADYIRRGDEGVTVIVQIEDREGVVNVAAIASVPGVDGLFVGCADLAVAMGATGPEDDIVTEAAATICRAADQAGKICGSFMIDRSSLAEQVRLGMNFFVIGSDQSALRDAWQQVVQDVSASVPKGAGSWRP